jgi:AcrR family transcriptional regulator
MDKPDGQTTAGRSAGPRGPASAPTRQRLMTAAAELIAELGWGRVTTRAVAERAGLPHGAISYHFRGKQELLTAAALDAFEQALPAEQFAALNSVDDLIDLIASQLRPSEMIDPVLSRLMLETMREAERDAALRERMGALLGQYRTMIVEIVRGDQRRGTITANVPAEAIATLLAALGDGLLLHALLDRDLDVAGAVTAVRDVLHR